MGAKNYLRQIEELTRNEWVGSYEGAQIVVNTREYSNEIGKRLGCESTTEVVLSIIKNDVAEVIKFECGRYDESNSTLTLREIRGNAGLIKFLRKRLPDKAKAGLADLLET